VLPPPGGPSQTSDAASEEKAGNVIVTKEEEYVGTRPPHSDFRPTLVLILTNDFATGALIFCRNAKRLGEWVAQKLQQVHAVL